MSNEDQQLTAPEPKQFNKELALYKGIVIGKVADALECDYGSFRDAEQALDVLAKECVKLKTQVELLKSLVGAKND